MENTSCGLECPFVKNGICKNEKECCNYLESFWISQESGKPTLIKDCAPKRLLLMQQEQVNYTLNLQQNIDELKKEINQLSTILINLINQTKVYLTEQSQNNQRLN